jgi:hypothetical protein
MVLVWAALLLAGCSDADFPERTASAANQRVCRDVTAVFDESEHRSARIVPLRSLTEDEAVLALPTSTAQLFVY